jgi:hypothetical protein
VYPPASCFLPTHLVITAAPRSSSRAWSAAFAIELLGCDCERGQRGQQNCPEHRRDDQLPLHDAPPFSPSWPGSRGSRFSPHGDALNVCGASTCVASPADPCADVPCRRSVSSWRS